MRDESGASKFPDGEPVRGITKEPSGSAFIVIICALMCGAIALGYLALRGCSVVP